MFEAECTSETSVYSYETTWRHIPKSYHDAGRCENLKSHNNFLVFKRKVPYVHILI